VITDRSVIRLKAGPEGDFSVIFLSGGFSHGGRMAGVGISTLIR
jgi:hypothetical protein